MSINDDSQQIYDLNGDVVAYINPNTIDSEKLSFNLLGENTIDVANAINENFIRLSQSFYGKTPPITPLKGQQWLNANDELYYVWKGTNWTQQSTDTVYDCFLYIQQDITSMEFVIDESVFNFTIENIKIYNQDMQDVKFIIDSFDSKKIILKEPNITSVYILVFHPKDNISNPYKNKKIDIFTTSGQTQFDIENFLIGTNINTISLTLNDIMIKNNEFNVVNNILTIDGAIYRVKENDKITIWQHGGSLMNYNSILHVASNKRKDYIRIPLFFNTIQSISIIDIDNNVQINPIEILETDEYIQFNFTSAKMIKSKIDIKVI